MYQMLMNVTQNSWYSKLQGFVSAQSHV